MRRRPRAGFSLVELFVVIVVIGVLVGLAIPRFRAYRRRLYLAAMASDLRNLAVTEEGYWSDAGAYTSDLGALRFTASPDVAVEMVSADTGGWSARATNAKDADVCAVYYGTAPALPPAAARSIIGCTK